MQLSVALELSCTQNKTWMEKFKGNSVNCIVLVHLYSAFLRMSLSEALLVCLNVSWEIEILTELMECKLRV